MKVTSIKTITIETIDNDTAGPTESTALMIVAKFDVLCKATFQKQQRKITEVIVTIVCEK